jgi:urease accessory protein
MTIEALLLLADARFPGGGHAHSSGLEAAVDDGRVVDIDSLALFLDGRLRTVALSDAALAAAVVARSPEPPWSELEAEARARTASPAARVASLTLGRQLLRAAAGVWPKSSELGSLRANSARTLPSSLSFPVALGAVAVVAGLDAHAAALLAVHHAVTGPAAAGVRLLGLDPVGVQAAVAALPLDAVAAAAAGCADGPLADLPGAGLLLADLGAERHARKEARLFAS